MDFAQLVRLVREERGIQFKVIRDMAGSSCPWLKADSPHQPRFSSIENLARALKLHYCPDVGWYAASGSQMARETHARQELEARRQC